MFRTLQESSRDREAAGLAASATAPSRARVAYPHRRAWAAGPTMKALCAATRGSELGAIFVAARLQR